MAVSTAKKAAEAMRKLYAWGTIQAIVESGCMPSGKPAEQVARIAKREQQKYLRQYDAAIDAARQQEAGGADVPG